MRVTAVTGTNGKTSTVEFTRQLLVAGGREASSFSSLGWTTRCGRDPEPPGLIGASALPDLLAQSASGGTDEVVIEAFSSSLASGMFDDVSADAAAFTNLSRDHIDHHGTVDAYFAAKERLFECVLRAEGTAVLNLDARPSRRLAEVVLRRGCSVIGYGLARGASVRLHSATQMATGMLVDIQVGGIRSAEFIPVVGKAMVYNVLAAVGLALAADLPVSVIMRHLKTLHAPPGRLEFVGFHNGGSVFVDYAHTPAALVALLKALRPLCSGSLVILFGCGGGRDVDKRPLMGRIARTLADDVVITDDNPRRENPATIRAAILAACPTAYELPDRADAIRFALQRLRPGDVLVLAGRGEERYQHFADSSVPFADHTVVQRLMSDLLLAEYIRTPVLAG